MATEHKPLIGKVLSLKNHLQRVSTFHRDSVIKGNVGDDVLYKAFMSVYWIAKQEIPKCKPVPLLQHLGKADVTEMKHFTHKSAGCVREHFLTLGQVIIEQLLEKVHRSIFFWSFVWWCHWYCSTWAVYQLYPVCWPDSDEVCRDFLFVENALANSKSADTRTLFTILTSKLQELRISTEKCSTLVRDGASVMLGAWSGLAARLKELNPTVVSIHCICHKLALACVGTSKDLNYIAKVEEDLRTLWKAMENSPKRTNMFLSV